MSYYVIKHEDMYLYEMHALVYRFASDQKRALRYKHKHAAKRNALALSKLCNDKFRVAKVVTK